MLNTIKKMEAVKLQAKKLWVNYIRETNVKKASRILTQRESCVNKMHILQQKIIDFYLPNKKENETYVYSLQQILSTSRKQVLFAENLFAV